MDESFGYQVHTTCLTMTQRIKIAGKLYAAMDDLLIQARYLTGVFPLEEDTDVLGSIVKTGNYLTAIGQARQE